MVPNCEWFTQVIVKLPDALANAGTVKVSITHANTSNQGSIFIK
jgi:glutamate dehydrogenase/leucine dehydrogenase